MSVPEPVLVSDVVKVLIVEPELIRNWMVFSRSLGIEEARLIRLNTQDKNGTISYTNLFHEIIQAWVSNRGPEATIGKLVDILREDMFNSAADHLMKLYDRNLQSESHPVTSYEPLGSHRKNSRLTSPSLRISRTEDLLYKMINSNQGSYETDTELEQSNNLLSPDEQRENNAKTQKEIFELRQLTNDSNSMSASPVNYKIKGPSKVAIYLIIVSIILSTMAYLCVKFIPFPSKIGKIKKPPIWYNLKEPSYIFKGREAELRSMEISFDFMQRTRELSAVIISGPRFSGKSELARKFAKQLWTTRDVNIFWLNGTDLESEFRTFMRSQLLLEPNSRSYEIFDKLQEKSLDPWLMIFDDVDSEDSIKCLKAIVKKFLHISGTVCPFVIITTNNPEKLDFLFRLPSVRMNYIELNDYGGFSHFMKNYVSPWVIENARSEDKKLVKNISSKIDASFEILEKHNLKSNVATKASFSLLVLIAYFIGDYWIEDYFLVKFWDLSFEEQVSNETYFATILKSFVDGQVLLERRFKIKCSSPEVSQVIQDYYLNYSEVNSVVNELLGIDSGEISLLRWLMQTLVKYFNLPLDERRNFDEGPHTLKLLNEVTEHNELVKEFKVEIVIIFNKTELYNFWKVEQISTTYQKYTKLFGGLDSSTLQLGNILASTLFRDGQYEESADLYEQLYQFTGLKFSKYDRRTYEVGDKAVRVFVIAGSKLKAKLVAAEMAKVCDESVHVVDKRDELNNTNCVTIGLEDEDINKAINNYYCVYKKCI